MQIPSLGREDPLKKVTATHASILAWGMPWTEGPGGLQSMGSQRVGHNRETKNNTVPGKSRLFFIVAVPIDIPTNSVREFFSCHTLSSNYYL